MQIIIYIMNYVIKDVIVHVTVIQYIPDEGHLLTIYAAYAHLAALDRDFLLILSVLATESPPK
jgi:hypothetical protein